MLSRRHGAGITSGCSPFTPTCGSEGAAVTFFKGIGAWSGVGKAMGGCAAPAAGPPPAFGVKEGKGCMAGGGAPGYGCGWCSVVAPATLGWGGAAAACCEVCWEAWYCGTLSSNSCLLTAPGQGWGAKGWAKTGAPPPPTPTQPPPLHGRGHPPPPPPPPLAAFALESPRTVDSVRVREMPSSPPPLPPLGILRFRPSPASACDRPCCGFPFSEDVGAHIEGTFNISRLFSRLPYEGAGLRRPV